MRLDLFVKLKYESRTIISFVSITHFMRDLISDLTRKLTICVRYSINVVSASSGIISQAVISMSNRSWRWRFIHVVFLQWRYNCLASWHYCLECKSINEFQVKRRNCILHEVCYSKDWYAITIVKQAINAISILRVNSELAM